MAAHEAGVGEPPRRDMANGALVDQCVAFRAEWAGPFLLTRRADKVHMSPLVLLRRLVMTRKLANLRRLAREAPAVEHRRIELLAL